MLRKILKFILTNKGYMKFVDWYYLLYGKFTRKRENKKLKTEKSNFFERYRRGTFMKIFGYATKFCKLLKIIEASFFQFCV